MPQCIKVIEAVRDFRLSSKSPGTIRLAEKPTHFHVENMPKGSIMIIPQVSSERRKYVPMGFMTDVMCSDKVRLLPNATLYHFGIMESNVHMAWMRAICCRLKSDYSYTINDVYNNFPWPTPTPEHLADLYDPVLMPPELLKAHRENDKAVMQAYGFPIKDFTESDCVAKLFKMYKAITEKE